MIKDNPLYREIVEGLNWNPSASNHSQSRYKNLPKKPRAYLLIACSGCNGITENEMLRAIRLSSSRNYVSELERKLHIRFNRVDEKNPDGIGSHYRYYLTCREDVQKVVNLILTYESTLLSEWDINQILALYPDKAA